MQLSRLALCTAVAFSCSSYGQEEAGSIDLGGFELIPALTTTLVHNDNVTRSNAEGVSSFATIISPEVILLNNFGTNTLQFGYRLSRGDYFSSQEDDYTDHFLSASLDYEINSKNRFTTEFIFEDGHDDRGTVFSLGIGDTLDSPDQFKQNEFDFVYTYGALNATARFDVSLNRRALNYDINTDAYKVRDRVHVDFGGSFYYRIGSATDLVVDVNHIDINYDFDINPELPLDSREKSILVGAQWEATAATSGYAKVGYQRKEFDSADRGDFSGVKWALGVDWQPIERATFGLASNGDTRETNGEGNFIRRKDLALSWDHEWLDRLSTQAIVSVGTDTYEGETNVRKDDIRVLDLSVSYQFRRWLRIRAGYQYDERDSNREAIDYDRNLFSISARVTL